VPVLRIISNPRTSVVFVVCALATLSLVLSQSRAAVILLVTDGLIALLLTSIITLTGTWLIPATHTGPLPLRWHLLLGAGLGCGGMSAGVLVLGICGQLQHYTWMVILGVLVVTAVCAVFRLARLRRVTREPSAFGPSVWLCLCITPFVALALLVSVVPPGVFWVEEGAGYDVQEYHLQLPKQYYQQGRIAYTPHNVYGNFAANVEMLYLLSIIVCDDVYDGAAVAKCVNTILGALCVFAGYVAGRERSYGCGILTAVVCASAGWLTYLCGVAYVENGMLMFAMMSTACFIRVHRRSHDTTSEFVWLFLSGLLAGFACGTKYTAALLVVVPLGVAVVVMSWRTVAAYRKSFLFCAAALVGFAPWLVKNTAMTGNPVFPLAHTLWDSYPPGWGHAEARHFDWSHQPDSGVPTLVERLHILWDRIPADPLQRFGPLLLILAGVRLFSSSRNRVDWALLAMLAIQVLGWTYGTHLYARFAVPLIIPLALLAGRSYDRATTRPRRVLLTVVTVAGTLFSLAHVSRLYVDHVYIDGRRLHLEGIDRYFRLGLMDGHQHLAVINQELPPDSKILLVGDAKAFYFERPVDYCVVFNRNPFVEVVQSSEVDRAIVDWFRRKQYTHVLVNWSEIHRLRSSRYGFPDVVQPELFRRLERAGLRLTHAFVTSRADRPYATLYQVQPAKSAREIGAGSESEE